MRRVILALFFSLALHAGFVAVAIGVGMFQDRLALPTLTVNSIDVEVQSLPLGSQKAKIASEQAASPPVRKKALTRKNQSATAVTLPADGGISDALPSSPSPPREAGVTHDANHRKPGDRYDYGPDGSTLVALLRFDRLRQSPMKDRYIAALDQLLKHLPDRHRLIEGTGLDLYQDFDSLLIATPDPTNAAVTFLAVRHRLTDQALRKALNHGATTLGQLVEWKEVVGRPVGIRRRAKPAPNTPTDRDDRIFVLLQPSLAIIATPAHAKLLLGPALQNGSQRGFQDLVAKIDAEEGAMPDSAVFMMVANKLFSIPRNEDSTTPATAENRPLRITGSVPGSLPSIVTLVAGTDPTPSVDLIAEFPKEADARQWEQALPAWRRKAMLNPILLLTGFSNLLSRIEVTQEGNPLSLHLTLTADELQRILTLIANLNRGAWRNTQ